MHCGPTFIILSLSLPHNSFGFSNLSYCSTFFFAGLRDVCPYNSEHRSNKLFTFHSERERKWLVCLPSGIVCFLSSIRVSTFTHFYFLGHDTHFYQSSKRSAVFLSSHPVSFHVAICLRPPNRKLRLLLASIVVRFCPTLNAVAAGNRCGYY